MLVQFVLRYVYSTVLFTAKLATRLAISRRQFILAYPLRSHIVGVIKSFFFCDDRWRDVEQFAKRSDYV